MDAYKGAMKLVACGGYGWHWDSVTRLQMRRTRKLVKNSVRRTARRKIKQSVPDAE